MSYIALYRKYRPQTFEDMVGQEHITKILKNQIETGKVSHAYIFSGTRGTGKTTAAKVFARAINCLNPKNGEPCNECEACKNILSGNTTDVVEMDAASNNSVENIRNIRQEVAYVTTGLKYKVYIIDEAHMLSTGAFNALLKTLEEPPENVVFILATTEEHKILPTILSRCIRLEFKKISKQDIKSRLKKVLVDYNMEYQEDALEEIATLADGGMRDALSILERCINSSDSITKSKVEEIVGVVEKAVLEELILNILEYNVKETAVSVDAILKSGKDLRNITNNITEEFLNILIYISSGKSGNISTALNAIVDKISVERVHQIIKNTSKLDEDLRMSSNAGVVFKAKMLGLATNTTIIESDPLIAKIKELELRIEKLENARQVSASVSIKQEIPKGKEKEELEIEPQVEEIKKTKEVKANAKVLKSLDKILKKVVDSDNLKLFSALTGIKAYEEGDAVVLATENSFAYGVLNKDSSRAELKKIIEGVEEKEYNVRIELIKGENKPQTSKFEEMMTGAGVPFEILD